MEKLGVKDKRENKFLSRKFLMCCGVIAGFIWLRHCGEMSDFYCSVICGLALLLGCVGTITDAMISRIHIGADGATVDMSEAVPGKVIPLNEDKVVDKGE